MNKIEDRLWLGNVHSAQDLQALRKAGITHILTVAAGIPPLFPSEFQYKVIAVSDVSS